MNPILTAIFANPLTTLVGAGLAVSNYLCAQPGGWQIVGTLGVLLLGALSHDPKKPA